MLIPDRAVALVADHCFGADKGLRGEEGARALSRVALEAAAPVVVAATFVEAAAALKVEVDRVRRSGGTPNLMVAVHWLRQVASELDPG